MAFLHVLKTAFVHDHQHEPENMFISGSSRSATSFVHSDTSGAAFSWENFHRAPVRMPPAIPTSQPADPYIPPPEADPTASPAASTSGGLPGVVPGAGGPQPSPRLDGEAPTPNELALERDLSFRLPQRPYSAPGGGLRPPLAPPIEDFLDGQFALPQSYAVQASTILMKSSRGNAGAKYRLAMQDMLFKGVIYATSIGVLAFAAGVHEMVRRLQGKVKDAELVEELSAEIGGSEKIPGGDAEEDADSSRGPATGSENHKVEDDDDLPSAASQAESMDMSDGGG
ncbi:unnamed protein product [Amoebophrya sp. A25]|nr:unnamed protein product [Amoebophrya sp. A25]|eukprot:GSA25T00010472001.1